MLEYDLCSDFISVSLPSNSLGVLLCLSVLAIEHLFCLCDLFVTVFGLTVLSVLVNEHLFCLCNLFVAVFCLTCLRMLSNSLGVFLRMRKILLCVTYLLLYFT